MQVLFIVYPQTHCSLTNRFKVQQYLWPHIKTTRAVSNEGGGIRFRSVHFKMKTREKGTQAVSVTDGQSSLDKKKSHC